MADGSLGVQIEQRVESTRRRLVGPALLRAAWPAVAWTAIFVLAWLSGLWQLIPLEARALGGVAFWLGLATLAWFGWRRWRAPEAAEARDLIDRSVEGRPMSAWTDRPVKPDADGYLLWNAHRERMAALAAAAAKVDLKARYRAADPYWTRFAAPVVLLLAVVLAGPQTLNRLASGLAPDIGVLFGAQKLTVEAWVTPPEYTGRAPFLLTSGERVETPIGSEVTMRIVSPGGAPTVKVHPVRGPNSERTLRPGVDKSFEAKVVVDKAMTIAIDFWGSRATFPFTVIVDKKPTVEFVKPPTLGPGDHTEFQWKVADDYGVRKLELVARLAHPPAGAEALEETAPAPLVSVDPKDEKGSFSQDLTRHRWAGLEVKVRLRATDAGGNIGESAEATYKLPEKLFLQPFAQSAAEIRATLLREWRPYAPVAKQDNFTASAGTPFPNFADYAASRLEKAPEGVKRAVTMLDAITYEPDGFMQDPMIYMGLRSARHEIEMAQDKAEADGAEDMLWNVAMRAEYGSVADAEAALKAARNALEEALRNGASGEEIKRLMDAYKQAVENYMAAKMAEAIRDGRVTESDQQQAASGGKPLGDEELQKMLDALQDLSETGARDQARQLLSQMDKMLDRMKNMQLNIQKGGQANNQPQGPMSRALNRALQETNRALNDQRDLSDQTEQAGRNGQQQKSQELAEQQRRLRERLEQQLKGGEQGQGQQGQQGQPGQQQGKNGEKGQQGQGKQGEGQQFGDNGANRKGDPRNGGEPGAGPDGKFNGQQESATSRRQLEQALGAQRRAEEALRRGDFNGARAAQQEAMNALSARQGELARLSDEQNPDAKANGEKDPMGRYANGASGFGDDTKVPTEMERQRARDILNEIRRRAGNRQLRADELDYLRRLLERF